MVTIGSIGGSGVGSSLSIIEERSYMRTNLETADLEAFVEVASRSNYRAAADYLNISSSALSRRIQKLEQLLGMRLFIRSTRRVRLTRAGVEMLQKAQEVLAQSDELLLAFKGRPHHRGATLTIAAVPSATSFLLPETMKIFWQSYPHVYIRIMDFTAGEVLEAVRSGAADLGFTYLGSHDGDLQARTLFSDDFVLAVPTGSSFEDRDLLTWTELAAVPVVTVWKGAGIRVLIDIELAKVGLSMKSLCEVRHVSTAIDFVKSGIGAAVVPRLSIPELNGVKAIKLHEPAISRTVSVIGFPDTYSRSLPAKFLEIIEGYVEARPPSRDWAAD